MKANAVVTVLPMMTAPALRRRATRAASRAGLWGECRAAGTSWHASNVDDVLDAYRDTMEGADRELVIEVVVPLSGVFERSLAIYRYPRPKGVIACIDACDRRRREVSRSHRPGPQSHGQVRGIEV